MTDQDASRLTTPSYWVAGSWRELWRCHMRKFIARMATLTRKIAEWLVPVLSAIKLLIEIVGKVANCHDRKLQIQISVAR